MRRASKSRLDLVALAVSTVPTVPTVPAVPALLAAVLAAALTLGLTGCSVDVEGATCQVVGAVDNCPSGQACGTDLKCSVKAAGCRPCDSTTPALCQDGDVKQCSASPDSVCGSWVTVTDCVTGQTCKNSPAGVATCVCDRWTVIPGGSAQACTSPSITGAITRALEFPAPTVTLGGASPAVYGNELVDAAPLIIPAGVTLIGDETEPVAAPLNRIIEVRASASAPNTLAAVVVEAGASLRGVTVRRFDAGAPALGVLLNGGSPAVGNSLVSVRIDFGGSSVPFGVGLSVAGGNAVASDVAVSDVHVQGATVAGLEVSRYAASHVLLVTDSTFDQNQVGVNLLRGDLTLAGTVVKRSAAEGVVAATGTPGQTSLTLVDDLISWNGRGGVRLSVNETLSITGTRICKNVGVDRSFSGVTRSVGGLYIVGNPPAASVLFAGNAIHDNGGDQLYVGAASAQWDLSGATGCAPGDRNILAAYVAPGVGLAAVGASVVAKFNAWAETFPLGGTDFYVPAASPGGSVDAGTGGGATDFCGAALPADLTCPAP